MDDYPFDCNIPKWLYKYTCARRALEILEEYKIYFAKPSEFNDPFDGLRMINIKTLEDRKLYIENYEKMAKDHGLSPMPVAEKEKILHDEEFAKNFSKNMQKTEEHMITIGYCCLSSVSDSLPMWAHYADNHKGCCLMFDFNNYCESNSESEYFPFMHMNKIEYCNDLPKHNMSILYGEYFHKSIEWEYEQEWRAMMHDCSMCKDDPDVREYKGYGSYRLPKNIIHGVILGYKMEISDKKRIKIAASKHGITVYQTDIKTDQYGMDIYPIK